MSNVPAISADGAGNGYTALQAKLKRLEAMTIQMVEVAEKVEHRMTTNAQAASRLGDLCASAEVAEVHLGAIEDINAAFARSARSGRGVKGALDGVLQATRKVRATHRVTYGGIHAASTATARRGVRQAKPGWYRAP